MEKIFPTPHTAEIRLLGRRIALKTSDDDPAFVAEVLDLVSSRLDEAEKRAKGTQVPHQVALLALLDLAEEYVRAKRRTQDYQAELTRHAEELMQMLQLRESDTPRHTSGSG